MRITNSYFLVILGYFQLLCRFLWSIAVMLGTDYTPLYLKAEIIVELKFDCCLLSFDCSLQKQVKSLVRLLLEAYFLL